MRNFKLALLLATVGLSSVIYSQQKKAASISGSVKDAHTKAPLVEAVVTIKSNSFEGEKYALTDSTGMYRLRNLPSGVYSISFEMEGYKKFTKDSIALAPGMLLGASFEMIKDPKKLKRVAVSNKEN